MKISVKKSEIILLFMDFLKQENLKKTLVTLESETGLYLNNYAKELFFLRQLILNGKWIDAEEFLKPLKDHPSFEYNSSIFEIKKQQFFELIEQESDQNENVEQLQELLREIQSRCTSIVFNEIMFILSLNSINEHSEYKTWTALSGRLKCFEKLREYLDLIYPISKDEEKISNNAFHEFLFFFLSNKDSSSKQPNISLLSMKKKDENNILVIEDDLKVKNKVLKDDNDIHRLNSSITMKLNRNQKVSQSLQINKVSDMEDKSYSNKKLYQPQSNNDYDEKSNQEVDFSDIDDETVINNKNKEYSNNALSDLDKEEYYMKSCYEFYDYDITSLAEKNTIEDTHPIRTSCFSPKGDYFTIGTNSKSIKIFNIKSMLQKFNKKNSYNFKPSGELNLTEEIKLIFEQKNHHAGSIYCLDWSVSGRLIASGSNDKLVKLMVIPDLEESFGLQQESLELTIPGHKSTVRSVCFEPTSDLILLSAGSVDKCIKVWDAEKGTNITNLQGHTNDVLTVKWSNDALICGSAGLDKTIRFWDLRDYKSTSLISALKYSEINDLSIFTKNKSSCTYVAAGHQSGTITIWDYNKKSLIKELFEHNDQVRSVSFSPDGKYLVSASFDYTMKLFDVENNFELIGSLQHEDRVVSVKWHPEVPLLISTSADKTAKIWIPETLKPNI